MKNALAENLDIVAKPTNTSAPIVVVGNGPVGIQATRLLLEKSDSTNVVLYGAEEAQPYNRVKLSSVLAGQESWQSIETDIIDFDDNRLTKRYGYAITSINTTRKTVTDSQGIVQSYSSLILATGSRPHIPNIPGAQIKGVYTLRNAKDLNALIARQVGSRHTVIIGAGLLGLETARAMRRWNTQVTVIEHAPRVLSRQLDDLGGLLLGEKIKEQGIDLVLDDGIKSIEGKDKLTAVNLRSGKQLECDTLIFATGIVPNTELALSGGIAIGKGIHVDDQMRTSAKDVYAIGECCEHRDRIYGIVAPGLEQAGVAVHNTLEGESQYQGSIAASKLKVMDESVLSIGPMGDEDTVSYGRKYTYRDAKNGIYRKLLVHRNRLVGVLSIGEWDQSARVQAHAINQSLIFPWQLWRFNFTGSIWPDEELTDVAQWPASATVCQCTGVTRGRISEVIASGASSCAQIANTTGASSVCGSCKPLVSQLLEDKAQPEPEPLAGFILATAFISLVVSLLFLSPLSLPYSDSVQPPFQWDWLWRDNFAKQVTGFTILGLFAIGLLISPRKRIKKVQNLGKYHLWRIAHLVLGIAVVIALFAHTGARMGSGLNLWLMLSFSLLLLLGAVSSGVLSQQHKIDAATATKLRRVSNKWHIYLFWPVPVLLTFHVLSSYWF